jgi:hypothetical protein
MLLDSQEVLILEVDVEDLSFLSHYGVKKMEWGVRQDGKPQGYGNPKDVRGVVPTGEKKDGTKKSSSDIASEVIAGKWGNNPARARRLKEAGYTAKEIQSEVNDILSGKKPKPKPTNTKTLNGKAKAKAKASPKKSVKSVKGKAAISKKKVAEKFKKNTKVSSTRGSKPKPKPPVKPASKPAAKPMTEDEEIRFMKMRNRR